MSRRRGKELTPQDAEKKTNYLYWWLLISIFFEYARPGSYFAPLKIIPLNSLLPLTLLVASFFADGLRPWSEIRKDRMAVWPAIFVAVVLISMAWATVKTYAFNTFTLILGYLFLYALIMRIVTTQQRLRGVCLTLIVAHLFLLLMNPEVVTDPNTRHYISGATFLGDGNDFSLSLCILLGFAVEVALRETSKMKRLFFWGLLLIIVLAIVGTQSRGATLGMGAVFGYLFLRSPKKGVALVAIAIAGMGVLLYAPDVYFQRLSTLKAPQQESSAEGRIMAWKAGTRMALDNVLGVGAGNFPNNFPKYRSADAPVRWMTAHSMYFLILGELGFLGLLLWLKLVFGNVRANVQLRRRISEPIDKSQPPNAAILANARTLDMLSASVFGLAVAGAFLSVAYYPHIFVLSGLLIAARLMIAAEAGVDLSSVRSPTRRPARRPAAARSAKQQLNSPQASRGPSS